MRSGTSYFEFLWICQLCCCFFCFVFYTQVTSHMHIIVCRKTTVLNVLSGFRIRSVLLDIYKLLIIYIYHTD